jgi:peptidoglycan hydrolase-like protein with peptidoglycan-binding domain
MRIAISSGHGTKVRGAEGYVDEVDEAIKIKEALSHALQEIGVQTVTYTDTQSTSQSENLDRIVDWHNAQNRDLDLSIHLNAYTSTTKPMGCEVLYLTQQQLAADISSAMAMTASLIDRGAKKRTDLAFLNGTDEPACLLECYFCDSSADVELFAQHFDSVMGAVAQTLAGEEPDEPSLPKPSPVPPLEISPPTIGYGDRGSSVAWVQNYLGANVDGSFGTGTEAAVEDYQERCGISVDGVVGPATWAQLNEDFDLPVYPPPALQPLSERTIREICETALSSEIAGYYWEERGIAPAGYIKGMAFSYATMLRKLSANDPVAIITAQADTHDTEHDALSWYGAEFNALDMDNSRGGVDVLRHLFVLLMGLGMRESSGRHCCGRDQSANNTDGMTCEAGLFQSSFNFSACTSDIIRLFDEYYQIGQSQQSASDLYEDDVSCSQSEWACYGSGQGYDYQVLAKNAPQFAVESTAIGLRYLRQHWGPCNRREIELRVEADNMFKDIEATMADEV